MDATDGTVVMRRRDSPSSETSEPYSDRQSPESIRPKPTDLGKRFLYYSVAEKKYKYGVLRYVGEPEFAEGTWCGLELNSAVGKNNGMLQGIRYFICQPNHGVFVPIDKVEMDQGRRSHSRPNSAPSSRSPSVDRELKPITTENETPSGGLRNKTINIQHELATRLSQQTPIHKRKAPIASSTGRMQPLKAFATRGIGREDKKETKRVLAPFKSGGMMKAQSTENIRSLKDSNKTVLGVMPGKKSSSERDLRGDGRTPASKQKPLNKKARVNSCSNLLSPDISTNTKKKAKPSTPSNVHARRPVSVVSPRTSTPGNRDNTPDGCSSPDDLSDSGSNASQEVKDSGSVVKTPDVCDTGFLETPEVPKDKLMDSGSGLATATRQLIETEKNSPSFNESCISSPEHVTGKFYKNRPSGSATLTHPLTQHIATDCAKRESLISKLLIHDALPEGVSLFDVLNLFREEYHHWTSKQVELEKQVQYLQGELLQMKTGKVDTGNLRSTNLQDKHRHTAV